MSNDAFGRCHPAVAFGYFAMAIGLSVMVQNPAFQVANLMLAVALCLFTGGSKQWRLIVGVMVLALAVALANPLFNKAGATVLFRWLGNRPYTLEAMLCGASMAAMLAAVLLWFASFNKVMSSDKLLYLFGPVLPALSLVLTMVLRLIPAYRHRASGILQAQEGLMVCVGPTDVGGGGDGGGADVGVGAADASEGSLPWRKPLRKRVAAGGRALSALATWALEGSIATADSMLSRGYGTGRRTCFARYGFTPFDAALGGVLAACSVMAVVGIAAAPAVQFFPTLEFLPMTPLGAVGFGAALALVALPVLLDAGEVAAWRIMQSRI